MMAKKTAANAKGKKISRRHSFLLTVCFISLAIIFVISLISIKKEIDSRNEEKSSLQSQLSEENSANEELQEVADSGDQDKYMEKVARENGYIKPGDRVYKDTAR